VPTVTRNPTSDISVSGTWSGTAGSRWTVVNDHPDTAGASELTHGTVAGFLTFGFAVPSIPAGSTINSVSVIYYDYKTAAQACTFGARLVVGENAYNAPTHNPNNGAANRTLRTDTWTTNPATGSEWTIEEVTQANSGAISSFGYNSGSDANPTIVTSSIQLVIDYTSAEPPAISATMAGAGTLTATLTGNVAVGATMAGTGALTATLTGNVAVGTTVAGSGTLTASLTGNVSISATCEGTSSLSAVLTQPEVVREIARFTQPRTSSVRMPYGSFQRSAPTFVKNHAFVGLVF
jgi:hypothetical protein